MSVQDLLAYARDKKSNALDAAQIIYSGVTYQVNDFLSAGTQGVYWDCLRENGAGNRSVLLPGNSLLVSLTNSDLIALVKSCMNMAQQMSDVLANIQQQILALTITTTGQIDSAWTSLMSSYTTNRVTQPTAEVLNNSILSMNPTAVINRPTRTTVSTVNAANGFQISSTKEASIVKYDINFSATATIGGAATVTAILEVAPTNSAVGTDYVEYARVSNSQTITLAIVLQSVQGITVPLIGFKIPAGYYARIRTVTTGTTSTTVQSSMEIY